LDAVHKIRGTLSKKVKEDLRKWNEQFGGVWKLFFIWWYLFV
jgi:hypothetical protein